MPESQLSRSYRTSTIHMQFLRCRQTREVKPPPSVSLILSISWLFLIPIFSSFKITKGLDLWWRANDLPRMSTYVQPLWGELRASTLSFSPQRTGSAGRDGTGTTGHQLQSACVLKFQKHACYAKKPSRLSPNFLPIRGIQSFEKATPHGMAQPFQSQTLLSCSPEQKALVPKEGTPTWTSYFILIHFKAAFFKGHHFLF